MGKGGFFSRWWRSGRTIGQVCEQKQPEGWVCGCPLTTSLSLLFVAQLSLRTVNSSRSAYACFLFAPLFFQQYQAATPGQDLLRCKILMKVRPFPQQWHYPTPGISTSCASALGYSVDAKWGERHVQAQSMQNTGRAMVKASQRGPERVMTLKFVKKVFPVCLPLTGDAGEDGGKMLHLPERPEQPPGGPAALQVRVLGEAVLPFSPALAEVTLGIGRGRRVILRSYHEEEADSTAKAMVTEMCLGEEDFQQLQAQEGVAITFCLKEFRGLLSFAESANLNLSIHFDAPGPPSSPSRTLCWTATLSWPHSQTPTRTPRTWAPQSVTSQCLSSRLTAHPTQTTLPMTTLTLT
nr:cell cycle checkpoint control protein RAD9A isoform X5 [Pan troglodytes]